MLTLALCTMAELAIQRHLPIQLIFDLCSARTRSAKVSPAIFEATHTLPQWQLASWNTSLGSKPSPCLSTPIHWCQREQAASPRIQLSIRPGSPPTCFIRSFGFPLLGRILQSPIVDFLGLFHAVRKATNSCARLLSLLSRSCQPSNSWRMYMIPCLVVQRELVR